MKEYIVVYNVSSNTEDFDDYLAITGNSYDEVYGLALKEINRYYRNCNITIIEIYQKSCELVR